MNGVYRKKLETREVYISAYLQSKKKDNNKDTAISYTTNREVVDFKNCKHIQKKKNF